MLWIPSLNLENIILGLFVIMFLCVYTWLADWNVPHDFGLLKILHNIRRFFRLTDRTEDYVSKLYNRFPDVRYYVHVGRNNYTVLLRNPNMIYDIIGDSKRFTATSPFEDINKFFNPQIARSIFSTKDVDWDARNNNLDECFLNSKMDPLLGFVHDAAQLYAISFFESPHSTLKNVDLKKTCMRYLVDVMISMVGNFSKDHVNTLCEFYKINNKCRTIVDDIKSATNINIPSLFTIHWTKLPFFSINLYNDVTNRKGDEAIESRIILRQRKNFLRGNVSRQDYLLLFKEPQLEEQLYIIMASSFESATHLICSAVHELALNSEAQEKVRKEVDHFLSEKREVSYRNIASMKYLDMVIKETLRMHPNLLMAELQSTEKYTFPVAAEEFCTFEANVGTKIEIPIYALHRDPKYFAESETFNPEHFSDQSKRYITPGTYIPFGAGDLNSATQMFSLMLTKIFLTYLLHYFKIKPNDKTGIKVGNHDRVTKYSHHGYWYMFEGRPLDD